MAIFDSHAHLNFQDFAADYQSVIAECQQNEVWLLNVGSQYQTSQKAI